MLPLLLLQAALAAAAPYNVFYTIKRDNGAVNQLPSQLEHARLLEPPKLHFSLEPESQEVREGETVEFLCEASGIPSPHVYWTFDGEPIEAPMGNEELALERLLNLGLVTVEFAVTRARLRLPCVSAAQGGRYACHATNGLKEIVAGAHLVVASSGNAIGACDAAEERRPLISAWTDSRLERQGAAVALLCRARGEPAPEVTWVDSEGEDVGEREGFRVLPSGDLFITQADWR